MDGTGTNETVRQSLAENWRVDAACPVVKTHPFQRFPQAPTPSRTSLGAQSVASSTEASSMVSSTAPSGVGALRQRPAQDVLIMAAGATEGAREAVAVLREGGAGERPNLSLGGAGERPSPMSSQPQTAKAQSDAGLSTASSGSALGRRTSLQQLPPHAKQPQSQQQHAPQAQQQQQQQPPGQGPRQVSVNSNAGSVLRSQGNSAAAPPGGRSPQPMPPCFSPQSTNTSPKSDSRFVGSRVGMVPQVRGRSPPASSVRSDASVVSRPSTLQRPAPAKGIGQR